MTPGRRLVACGSGGVLAVRGYPASPGYAPVAPFPTALDGGISDAVLVFAREKDNHDHHARHGHREGSTPTLDVHVAAALDAIGGVLSVESFPPTGRLPGHLGSPGLQLRFSVACDG
jgi:hypothetical protein